MKLKYLFIASLSFALLGATSEAVFAAKPARKTTKTTKPKKTKTPKAKEVITGSSDSIADIMEENIIVAKVLEIPISSPVPPPAPKKIGSEKIYESAEQDPAFPGGQVALLQYVASHIKYPETAQENGIQGRVVVRFVVKKDGSIGEVEVVRGKDPDLDEEAVRVIKSLPKFTPGMMNGQPVNCWYTLPLMFKLQD